MDWIREQNGFCIVQLHIIPNSKKTEILGLYNNRLKIKISAPPVDGKANACIIEYLSSFLSTSRSSIEILRGETSKWKQCKIIGFSENVLKTLLLKRSTT